MPEWVKPFRNPERPSGQSPTALRWKPEGPGIPGLVPIRSGRQSPAPDANVGIRTGFPTSCSKLTCGVKRLPSFDFKLHAGRALALTLPLLGATLDCRYAVLQSQQQVDAGEVAVQRHPARGVYIFWHEHIAALLCHWQQVPMTLLVSQHKDAEWLVHLAGAMGYGLVRGSTTRGGANAIRELRQAAGTTAIGITPDGPRGPRRQLALGPLWLASRIGLPIYCVAASLSRAKRLGTWDRFALPLPGCRTRILFSPPVHIPADSSREELESMRSSVQTLMDQMHQLTDQWLTGEHLLNGRRPDHVRNRLWPSTLAGQRDSTPETGPAAGKTDGSKPRERAA